MALAVIPRAMRVDQNGNPRVGARLFFFDATTTTPRKSYTTPAFSAEHTYPIPADSNGVFPAAWFNPADGTGAYKRVVRAADDDGTGTPLESDDNLPMVPFDLDGIGSVLYPRTSAEIAASVTPTDLGYFPPIGVDVRRFGVVGDGSTDDSVAMALAINSNQPLDLSNLTIRIVTKLTFNKAGQRVYARGGGFKFDGSQVSTTRLADITASGVEFHCVDFDFNSKQVLGGGIYIASNAARPKFTYCHVRRINGTHVGGTTNNSSNNQSGILISPYGVEGFLIHGCWFNDLKNDNATANGTTPATGLGFVNGVAFLTDDFAAPDTVQTVPTSGTIGSCLFKDIKTVLAGGLSAGNQVEFNDADGVRFFGSVTGLTKLHVKVTKCLFYDCSKRAVKNSTAAGTSVEDITVISTTALSYPMVCAVKVDGDDQTVRNVRIIAPSTAPILQMIQSHDCQYLHVSGVVANYCNTVWDFAPTSTAIVTQGWRVENIQCSSVAEIGFRTTANCARYVDCDFSGLSIEAASTAHNVIGFQIGANTDRVEVTLRDSRFVNCDVKINGYGWTFRNVYQEIDDASYAGQSTSIAMLEAGLDPATAVTRNSVIDGYTLNIKTLPDAYLSASRPYLFLLYGKRVKVNGFKVTTPDSLATTRSHGAFGGGDESELTNFEYSGEGWITWGVIYTGPHRRMTIRGARRVGGTAADQEFLNVDHGQDCVLANIEDYRDASSAGTINVVGGTVSGSRTYAYIIDGVRSFSTATFIVGDSGNKAYKANILGFDGRDQSENRQHNLVDGITAPATVSGRAQIYVDTSSGDLSVRYGDGTTKVIVADT